MNTIKFKVVAVTLWGGNTPSELEGQLPSLVLNANYIPNVLKHQMWSTSPEEVSHQFHCHLCTRDARSPDLGPNGVEYLDRCIWHSKERMHVLIGVTRTCAVSTIEAHADARNDRKVTQTEAEVVLPE